MTRQQPLSLGSFNDRFAAMYSSGRALLSADGEPVTVYDMGGNGPALLLGHGNGLNAGMWFGVVPLLQEHFRCFGVDLRGHGANRPINPDYSVDRFRLGQDVIAAVNAIGEPVVYAGHSLGGASGVFAALQDHNIFTSMWLYEPVVIPDWLDRSSPPSALLEAAKRRRSVFASEQEAYDRFRVKPPFDGCAPEAVAAYVRIGTRPVDGADPVPPELDKGEAVALSCRPADEARVFGSGQPIDFARLEAITMPAVVVAGADTGDVHAIPAQMAKPIADALGNARYVVAEGLGHFGPMEAPSDVAQMVITHC